MKDKTEYLTIVDDEDNVIGKATWREMHEKGLTHRTANVFVYNSKGEIFVHKRAKDLLLFPSMYDVKVGGGVGVGESYEETARRELEEECGIKGAGIAFLFAMKTRMKKRNVNRKIFSCVYDGELKLQKDEVEEGGFMKIGEAIKLMEEGKLSPSAEDVFREFLKREGRE